MSRGHKRSSNKLFSTISTLPPFRVSKFPCLTDMLRPNVLFCSDSIIPLSGNDRLRSSEMCSNTTYRVRYASRILHEPKPASSQSLQPNDRCKYPSVSERRNSSHSRLIRFFRRLVFLGRDRHHSSMPYTGVNSPGSILHSEIVQLHHTCSI